MSCQTIQRQPRVHDEDVFVHQPGVVNGGWGEGGGEGSKPILSRNPKGGGAREPKELNVTGSKPISGI